MNTLKPLPKSTTNLVRPRNKALLANKYLRQEGQAIPLWGKAPLLSDG